MIVPRGLIHKIGVIAGEIARPYGPDVVLRVLDAANVHDRVRGKRVDGVVVNEPGVAVSTVVINENSVGTDSPDQVIVRQGTGSKPDGCAH